MAALHLLQMLWPSFSRYRMIESYQQRRRRMEKLKEANFNLGAVLEVRIKIAKACDWANGSVDEPVGSIDRQEGLLPRGAH
jgi:hypothetical protein